MQPLKPGCLHVEILYRRRVLCCILDVVSLYLHVSSWLDIITPVEAERVKTGCFSATFMGIKMQSGCVQF